MDDTPVNELQDTPKRWAEAIRLARNGGDADKCALLELVDWMGKAGELLVGCSPSEADYIRLSSGKYLPANERAFASNYKCFRLRVA